MANSSGHVSHAGPGHSLSTVLSWNRPTGHSAGQTRPEMQEAREEAIQENMDGQLPSEWVQVSRLAMKQLDRCVSLEPKVLQGDDPDAIHDLRVATRRLQQVFDLLYPSPRSAELRKTYRGLKRCRRSLSEVRNFDVLLDRVNGVLGRKRAARREAWETIRKHLEELRSVRLEKSLRKLAKANLSAIYIQLKERLPAEENSIPEAETSNHPGAVQDLTVEEFHRRISQALKKAWTALEEEIEQSRQEPDPAVLHRTRIAAKRVRYLVEVINAFDIPGSKDVLIWLRNLQTHLGNWHDLVVFEDAVIDMLADTSFLRHHLEMAVQIERLIMRNRAQKAKLEAKYSELTLDKTGFLKTREWVRRAVDSPASAFAGSP